MQFEYDYEIMSIIFFCSSSSSRKTRSVSIDPEFCCKINSSNPLTLQPPRLNFILSVSSIHDCDGCYACDDGNDDDDDFYFQPCHEKGGGKRKERKALGK